jgi:hypothetical protein
MPRPPFLCKNILPGGLFLSKYMFPDTGKVTMVIRLNQNAG